MSERGMAWNLILESIIFFCWSVSVISIWVCEVNFDFAYSNSVSSMIQRTFVLSLINFCKLISRDLLLPTSV